MLLWNKRKRNTTAFSSSSSVYWPSVFVEALCYWTLDQLPPLVSIICQYMCLRKKVMGPLFDFSVHFDMSICHSATLDASLQYWCEENVGSSDMIIPFQLSLFDSGKDVFLMDYRVPDIVTKFVICYKWCQWWLCRISFQVMSLEFYS